MRKIYALLTIVLLVAVATVNGQTTLISSSGNGGFETGSTPAANGWTAVNSSTDGWYVGAVPVVSAGTRCAYISSTAGAAWTYSQLSVIQHLYYDVTIPAGETKVTLTFKWKVGGEGTTTSDWDNMKVFWGPSASVGVPVANTAVSSTFQVSGAGAISGMYKLSSAAYNSETISLTGVPGTTYRLVFSWKSDGSTIANPPAAIDEVNLVSAAPSNISSTATGGLWSAASTWVGGVVPNGGDNATIVDGATVTIDMSPSIGTLTVGSGTSGILQFEQTTARTLSVSGNITIATGGTFRSNPIGAVTTHVLSAAGNITNNGTLDFSTNSNVAAAGITFTGSADQLISGTGAVTDLFNLTMSKTALANLVEFNVSNFTVRGVSSSLTTTVLTSSSGTGTIKFSGSNTFSGTLWSTAGYTLASTLGVWINNPNFTVQGLGGSPTISGLLRISAGTYNIGIATGNTASGSSSTTQVTVEGGVLNVAGRLNLTSSSNYTQSGGTVNVCVFGNSSSGNPSFNFAGSVFTMSGGTIVINGRNSGATNNDFSVLPTTTNITGGTLQVGSASSTSGTWRIQGNTPNLSMYSNGTTINASITQYGAVTVNGDMTLNGTGTYSNNSTGLTLKGNSATNPGNLTINTGSVFTINSSNTQALSFSGSFGNQTLTNSGTITSSQLPSLTINNTFASGTVTIPTSLQLMSGSTLTLTAGTLNIGAGGTGTISLGNATAGTFSCTRTLGSMVATGGTSFGAGVTTKSYTYNGAATMSTGAEMTTGSSVTIDNLTLNNASAIVSLDKAVSTGTFTLTNGKLVTTAANILNITGTTVASVSRTAGFVSGPMTRVLPASLVTGSTYLFPLGKGTYNPFEMVNPTTGAGGAVTVSAEVFDANAGGTPGINMGALNTDRYWAASITSGAANFTNTFIRLNDASVVATSAIASSSTLAGSYDLVGSTSPTIVLGTSVTSTTTASTSIPGFYVVGIKAVPMTYTSGTTTQNVTSAIIKPATNQQIIGVQIVTTGNASPLTLSSMDFNTNGSTAPVADISNARVWYTGTSSTFATTTQFGTDYATPSGAFTVTGSQVLAEGTNYFWLVYDVPSGATVNNFLDAECTAFNIGTTQNPSTTAPVGNRIIKAALNGTYLIGASQTAPNYVKLTDAITDLNAYGVSGPVILALQSDYSSASETFPLTFNSISGGSAVNTVTIRPGSGVTATISGSLSSAALIKLNGADYVTIDGSNSGGTDKSLTITNTATTAPSVISVISLGAGAGATNNSIKNCNISTGVQTSTGYGIAVGGATPGNTGADNDNVTIQNNSISGCVVGIYAQGTAAVSAGGNDNLNITGNTITYNSNLGANVGINVSNSVNSTITQNNISITTTATSGTGIGMQLANTTGATVSQNTISVVTAASTAPVGISLENGFVSSTVSKNLITGVTAFNTGGYGGRGITIGTGTASSNLTLSNNMIYGVNGSNFSGFGNSSSMGIAIGVVGGSTTLTTTTGGVNLYFNSVNMYGDHSYSSATITTALYVGSGATALDIRNNIFANRLNNTTTSGSKNYCIYSAAANTAFTNINYNDYYPVTSANSTGLVGFLGSDQAAIAAWRTASAQDALSLSSDPKFISNTNLHINTAVVTPVESAGITIGTVSDDYDGDVRAGTPDIGADEGVFIAPAANDMAATAFVNPTNAGSKTVAVAFTPQASFTNSGTAPQTNVPVRFRIVDAGLVEVYNQTATIASISSSTSTTVTFPSVTLSTVGSYTMYAKAELAGDVISANDEITGSFTVTDPYTSSTTTQNTSNIGLNTTNQQVIGMQVVVAGTSATATSFTFNTNGTTAPATDITNAKIFYTGTTSTFSATGQFGSTVASPNGSHTVTGTQVLSNGTNYFWLTYDIPSGATAGNAVDAEFTSVNVNGIDHTPSTTAPAGSRTIVGPMSGTYLVGAGQTAPNFTNLTNAIADLNIRGVSGATVFELQGTYSSASETFPLTINAFAGASAVNTLTIKPGTGVTANISGSSTVSIIKLNGADYVTIDGSNNGTTSRDLTLTNTTTGSILWIGTDATTGATNNTFKNANMVGPGAFTGQGILAGSGTTAGNAAETGRPNSNNTIQNITAKSVQNGVYIAGDATTPDQNWLITQNSLGSAVTAEKLSYRGIAISSAQNFTITQNTIFGVVSSSGSSSNMSGISVYGTDNGGTIAGNKISDIKQVNSTGWGSNGIYLGATSTASNISVYNNFISDVASYGYAGSAASDNGYGIVVDAGGGYKIYYNTVVLTTNQTLSSSIPAALNITSTAVTAGSIDLRDNIFVNNQTAGTRYAIYCGASNTVFSNIDYNNYAVASGGTLGYIGSNRATISAIQTGFGGNVNSLNITPVFVNALTDFHLTTANTGLKAGLPLAAVTVDYDAQTRNITLPAIGADEVLLPNFWAGNTSADWNTTTNWDDATVPSSGANIKIPAGVPNMPALAAVTTVGNLSLGTGTTLNLAGTSLTINGAISGTGTITGSSTSNLTIGGAAGTLNFTQTSAATRSLNNLSMTGTSATLGTALDIYGVLTVSAGTLDLNGKAVTLKSISNAATARVAPVTGTLSGATNVTVERYIADAGHRAWHLLSAKAVTGTQSIFSAWQEGGAAAASVPGYGTWITSTLYDGVNGFDATNQNLASIITHVQGGGAGPSWNYAMSNTNATALSFNQGYMLFVRGDRAQTAATTYTTGNAATTLRTNGTLTQGNQSATVSATGTGRTLVGNPYASPIDMETIFTGTTNLDQDMYVWDATATGNYGVGAFSVVTRDNSGNYAITPYGGSATADANSRYIHSGQAFFLKASGSDATVNFTENVKASSLSAVNPIVNTAATDHQIWANLMIVNPCNNASLADGIRVRFDDSYSASTSDDILKMGNFAENISSYRDSKKLIVERRPNITVKDTIFLRMTNTGIKDYRFRIGTINFIQPGMIAYLEDTYKNTRSPLDLTGIENEVDFSITADVASANPDRFRIVFAAAGPLPVTITKISAVQQGSNVAVQWNVSNQYNMKQYEVERSADGIHFSKMTTQAATGANGSDASYNWLDVSPVPGDNYYRISGVGTAGDIKLSNVVRVTISKGNPAITVYPNPVINRTIALQLTDMTKGIYQLRLFNSAGQVVFSTQVSHNGGSATQTLGLGRGIAKGNYQLEITGPDSNRTIRSLLIAD